MPHPTTSAKEAEVGWFYEDLQDLELTSKKKKKKRKEKDVLFIIGNWNAKVVNQEISGVTGKFALGEQNTRFQQHKRRLCTPSSDKRGE